MREKCEVRIEERKREGKDQEGEGDESKKIKRDKRHLNQIDPDRGYSMLTPGEII